MVIFNRQPRTAKDSGIGHGLASALEDKEQGSRIAQRLRK